MAIRIYELSKILGVTNKDIISFLKDNGYSISSHISVVPEEAIELIDKKFGSKKQEKKIETSNEKKEPNEVSNVKKSVNNKNNNLEKLESEKENEDEDEVQQKEIYLTSTSLGDIAERINKPVNEIILDLLKQGIIVTKNQLLDEKIIKKLANLYELKIIELPKEEKKEVEFKSETSEGNWIERLPIVVVIGHVDHGKTTLLDFIRKTHVAAKEKGGITQHLGAYEVHTKQGTMIFLDTPGHEAFIMLRARGIKIADIAILVVAVDDGVMPQTIEAINRAHTAGLPLIVALNKIDKAASSQIEVVKQQLTQHGLVPEEWGGQTVMMPISAKAGTGINELLDVIILQAKLMDLKANLSIPAKGYILESKLEKGRGPVGTVISQHGQLKIGDYFIAGNTSGKVSSLVNSSGERVTQTIPSIPIRISGFDELPNVGDIFQVVSQDEYKKFVSKSKSNDFNLSKKATTSGSINLIIKVDNVSSKEALISAIEKLSNKLTEGMNFNIIHSGIGNVTESDVILASETGSTIYGLHIKAESGMNEIIQQKKVKVKQFDIIYKLLEDLEKLAESSKPVKMILTKVGDATVIKIFDIKNIGIIAGARVKHGKFVRDGKVIVFRHGKKIGQGAIKALQREKKPVKEVNVGYECAFLIDQFSDWQIDDNVECFQEVVSN